MITKVSLACDHGGFALKEKVKAHLLARDIAVVDCGTPVKEAVDYPDMAVAACTLVQQGEVQAALLFCGTGIGISIAANKMKGIRACCTDDAFCAKYTRLHNDANALCLGGRVVGDGVACELVDIFLETEFEGGRHSVRLAKIAEIEAAQ